MKPWLDQHDVLSFTREPLARGLAFGMFCSLIPGPLQLLGTFFACALWRGNILAGAAATVISNPLTIVPLYVLAYQIGAFILPGEQILPAMQAFSFASPDWVSELSNWIRSMGWPLLVGLIILAQLLALLAYSAVQILFLIPVLRRLKRLNKYREQVQN